MTHRVPPTPVIPLHHMPGDVPGRVRAYLRERLELLSEAARRARAGDDREAAHDLRVATRRLAAAVRLWGDILEPEAAREMRRRLRRMRRRAGALRDLEVHAPMLHARAAASTGEERLALEALAARLERRLPRAVRRTARAARKGRVRGVERALARAMEALGAPETSAHDVSTGSHAGVVPIAAAASAGAPARLLPPPTAPDLEPFARESLAALGAAVATEHDEEFHAARLAIKAWRYATEAIEAVYDGRVPNETSSLRALQQALGTLQDIVALRARIARRREQLLAQGRNAEAGALAMADATLIHERSAAIAAIGHLAAQRLENTPRPDARPGDQRRSPTPGA